MPAAQQRPRPNSEIVFGGEVSSWPLSLLQASFNNLVGAGEQHRWNFEAERLGGLEIENQLDLCRLLDRKVGRLFAFENAPSIDTNLTVRLGKAASVAR